MSNKILDFKGIPRYDEITPEESYSAMDKATSDLSLAIDDIASNNVITWNSVWMPLVTAEEKIFRVWLQIQHMRSINNSALWCEAYEKNIPKFSSCVINLHQNKEIYKKLLMLSQKTGELSDSQQKKLQDKLNEFVLSGINLSSAERKEFLNNKKELSILSCNFEKNIRDSANNDCLEITHKKLLRNIPDECLCKSIEIEGGGIRIPLTVSVYLNFMTLCKDRKLRKLVYEKYTSLSSDLGLSQYDNSPIINNILLLRSRQADLLGFKNYAELVLQRNTFNSPEQIVDFLSEIMIKMNKGMQKEMDKIKDFARDKWAIHDLQRWDINFIIRDFFTRTVFNEEGMPPLELKQALTGALYCIEQMFNVRLKIASAPKWTQEVQFYNVYNVYNELIGGIYLDLFKRDNKDAEPQTDRLLLRFQRGDELQLPLSSVICNFTSPKKLNNTEVKLLFHELGHAMHQILIECTDSSAMMINKIDFDMSELPSLFMEKFAWDKQVIEYIIAVYNKNGHNINTVLLDKISNVHRFSSAIEMIFKLERAMFDISIHKEQRPFVDVAIESCQYTSILSTTTAEGRYPCKLSHPLLSNYASVFYSYVLAEVLSADIFEMFTQSGDVINSDLGNKFRQDVLSPGNSRSMMESFVTMRGRKFDISALLRYYKLS